MANNVIVDVLFSMFGLVSALVVVAGGILALKAVRSAGSVVLLIGAVMMLCNSLGWSVFQVAQMTGNMEGLPVFISLMRVFGTIAWLLTAVGVLLLAINAVKLRRENEALQALMAGSQNDRVA